MKTVTLKEVEEFLTEHPIEKFRVSDDAYFANTNVWGDDPLKVEEAGEDFGFYFRNTTLRRFGGREKDFQSATFLHTPDEALEVVRAYLALEVILGLTFEVVE